MQRPWETTLFRTLLQWQRTEDCDDASLVSAARDGDRRAFGQLYSRYSRMVHGILLARVDSNDVDDLVHDVFLVALPRLEALRDVRAFPGWLAAIARNRANDHRRRSRPKVASLIVRDREVDSPAPEGPEDSGAEAILERIRSLPGAYRETLILRLVEGMTGPEIAARTGLTPGSVRVNLHRGLRKLRQQLEERSGKDNRVGLGSRIAHTLIAHWEKATRRRNPL